MFKDLIHSKLNITDSYEAPAKLLEVLYNKKERETLFKELEKEYTIDLSYDWFHQYFQEEHAERKKHKQDFTPMQVAEITSRITAREGQTYHESAVGSGGMAISHWSKGNKDNFYYLEELSSRAIPFLLFNLLIRGMNAIVIHGDSLNRTCKGVFFIQNNGKYSNINLMPYTNDIEKEFNITFIGERYKPIKEDYNKKLEQNIWLDNFDKVFNWATKQRTIKTDVTTKYGKNTVGEVLKDYKRAIITSNGIIGIYPERMDKELLDKVAKEVVEIKGVGSVLVRIKI